jgi:hypothetical protein
MAQDMSWVAQAEAEARRNVEKSKAMRFAPDSLPLLPLATAGESLSHPEPNYLRSAVKGSAVGLVIGVFLGVAMLATIGLAIPNLFEAVLFLACSAFGGILFGSLIGSSGAFSRTPR